MNRLLLTCSILAFTAVAGCAKNSVYDGPTVEAFNGKVVAGTQPVKFSAGEEVLLQLFHERGRSFLIPITADGTFNIGWMPIGKYSATLLREQKKGKASVPSRHNVAGGLTVVDGQTAYTIDLGKDYKP